MSGREAGKIENVHITVFNWKPHASKLPFTQVDRSSVAATGASFAPMGPPLQSRGPPAKEFSGLGLFS